MLTLLKCVRSAWNDYFTTTNPTNPNSQTYTSRQTFSDTSVYISNCLFRSITSGSDGGALYCTSVTYLLVELTSYFSCSTSSRYGGALYFSNTGSGQCVLHSVCGYDCCSTYTSRSDGQFARIYVNNGLTSKNYVNYSSIVRCVNQISGSYYVLWLSSGRIYCPSINISMNKCPYISSIHCNPFTDSNSFTCSLTYSTIADNFASISVLIYLTTGGANYEINNCNILRNTQGYHGTDGTFCTYGNLMIKDSCILENIAYYIFRQYSSYTITLSSCTIDSTSNDGRLTTENTVTKSFILALNHMFTRNCYSEYDAIGMLTPIKQSPSSTRKQIQLCTCGKCFCRCQLGDFFSLHSIFIFNFIHLGASNYPSF
jgi:hypothetical protein